MAGFFKNIALDDAEMIESLARVMYELRENRAQLLKQSDVENEKELLGKIVSGKIAEHPAYEQYLSACILEMTRETIRAELKSVLQEVAPE